METLKYFAQLHENTLIYGFTDMQVAGRLHEKCTNEHEEPRFYIIVVNLSLLPQKIRNMDPPILIVEACYVIVLNSTD